jgi:hypothetical protein
MDRRIRDVTGWPLEDFRAAGIVLETKLLESDSRAGDADPRTQRLAPRKAGEVGQGQHVTTHSLGGKTMRKLFAFGAALAIATSAYAAPNIAQNTQKGSLLIFPDIRVDDGFNTIVRLSNDGSLAVDVKCIWMDGNKNRTDFIVTLTKNQTIWFDARGGDGTIPVNPMPYTAANGFDNPFLVGPGATEATDTAGPYEKGMLVCFAVDGGAMNQVKWNHLFGSATVFNGREGTAYEYTAYSFYVPSGSDQGPVGTAGTLNLNGLEYDACPLYMTGAMTPAGYHLNSKFVHGEGQFWYFVDANRIAVSSCALNLNQDWQPVYTKLQFDVWDSNETKLTGGYECADSWHESIFTDIDAAAQVFTKSTVDTDALRYRVQGVKSTQCKPTVAETKAVGILAIQSTLISFGPQGPFAATGTNLTAAGKATQPENKIVWDPEGAVPEGRIR